MEFFIIISVGTMITRIHFSCSIPAPFKLHLRKPKYVTSNQDHLGYSERHQISNVSAEGWIGCNGELYAETMTCHVITDYK